MDSPIDYKQAAIDQWTADPCGEVVAEGETGTRRYFEKLLESRDDYAYWMHETLGYAETDGLDVLDVGCGQGIDVVRYALGGARVTGMDLTPRHVELAKLHTAAMGLDVTIIEGDAEAMPFPDESFDRVSSNGVLHHTPDMPTALREIHRVLRPGGQTCVIVYNRSSLHYWVNQVAYHGIGRGEIFRERSMAGVLSRNVEYSSTGARPLVRVYSPRQVRRLLTEAGFANVSTTIRHFHAEDAFVTHALARHISRLRDPHTLARIGRMAGWYIVGRGSRASAG